MGTISVSLPSDGSTADVADYNTPITTIVNTVNGNIDNANIKSGAAIDASKLASNSLTNTQMATSISPVTRFDEATFDFVASGLVWSGDSYGSTRVASMTAGVVYIDGKRLTVAAVTARSFTASKDTYIDLSDNGDGTAAITYTEVANNAASPALTANYMRIGIMVTAAGSIAAVGSVNQGEETKVLPIASSIPYAVTDSLGNLICPRDPNRKILGYRQRTSGNFTTTNTTATQITELSVPVIVPTGRKVRVVISGSSIYSSSGTIGAIASIWDGAVAGTRLNVAGGFGNSSAAGAVTNLNLDAIITPTSASKTYNASLHAQSAATATLEASSTSPVHIRVELA